MGGILDAFCHVEGVVAELRESKAEEGGAGSGNSEDEEAHWFDSCGIVLVDGRHYFRRAAGSRNVETKLGVNFHKTGYL